MTIPEPTLVFREEQPYVGVRSRVTMAEIGTVLPPLNREVHAWLARKSMKPAGAPFWRYLIVDMSGTLEIDAAFPVDVAVPGDSRIVSDVLPSGRYATTVYVGHPDGLMQATADLLSWADRRNIRWQMNGPNWGGRTEWYLSDPVEEPDMSKWKTELAFLTTER